MLTWDDFLIGLSLLLVFEGIMPFVMPEKWREAIMSIASLKPAHIRMIGLCSMLSGLFLLSILGS